MLACSHHRIPTRAPCIRSVASQRSRSNQIAMYCATMFFLCLMYTSIISNPASALAVTVVVYYHFLSARLCRSCPVNCCAIWYRKTPKTRPMRGVTTHESAQHISTN